VLETPSNLLNRLGLALDLRKAFMILAQDVKNAVCKPHIAAQILFLDRGLERWCIVSQGIQSGPAVLVR
jgi:hypothetical protein